MAAGQILPDVIAMHDTLAASTASLVKLWEVEGAWMQRQGKDGHAQRSRLEKKFALAMASATSSGVNFSAPNSLLGKLIGGRQHCALDSAPWIIRTGLEVLVLSVAIRHHTQ